MNSISRNQPDIFRYQILRAFFVCGYVLSVVLTFVPAYRIRTRVGGFFDNHLEYRVLSTYDLIQFMHQEGEYGWWMFYVLIFAVAIAFIALALKYPKQWVFIAGATFAGFLLLLNLFSGTPEGIEHLLIPTVVDYISTILILSGFFIKPPPLK